MVDLNKHIYGDGFGPGGLDSWLSVTEGLTLVAPFVKTNTVYSVAGGNMEALTTKTVDADGTKRSWGGVIAQATANTARWQPGRGVLAEGARTNLCLRSDDYDHAAWVKTNAPVVTTNNSIAPDGNLTADLIATDGALTRFLTQTVAIANDNTQYVATRFYKRTSGRTTFPGLSLRLDGGGTVISDWLVNTNIGTVTARSVNAGAVSGGVESHGDYWRVRATATNNTSGNTALLLRPFPDVGSAAVWNFTNAGDCTVWGDQPEVGTFPSSYIPTAAASVARAADDLDIDNTGGLHVPAATGTIYAAVTPQYDAADITAVATVYDVRAAGNADGVYLYGDAASDAWHLKVRSGGGNAADIDSATLVPVAGTTHILAITWALNDFNLYANGLLEGNDALGPAPAATGATIFLGQSNANGLPADADIGCLICYDSAHNAGQVQSVTKDIAREMGVLL